MSGSSIPIRSVEALPEADTLNGGELVVVQQQDEFGTWRTRRAPLGGAVQAGAPRAHNHILAEITGAAAAIQDAATQISVDGASVVAGRLILSRPTLPDIDAGTVVGPAGATGPVAVAGTPLGVWDASTNTPALSNGSGAPGESYVVSVAGSTSLDGITAWGIGDVAYRGATAWTRILSAGAAGAFGVLTLTGDRTEAAQRDIDAAVALTDKFGEVFEDLAADGTRSIARLTVTDATIAVETVAERRLGSDVTEIAGAGRANSQQIGMDPWGTVFQEMDDDGTTRHARLEAGNLVAAAAALTTITLGPDVTIRADGQDWAADVRVDRWGTVFQQTGFDGVLQAAGLVADTLPGGGGGGGDPDAYSAAEIEARNARALALSAMPAGQLTAELQLPTAKWWHILGYGQSLSRGAEGWPALSKPAKGHGAWMFGAAVRCAETTAPTWTACSPAALTPLAANVTNSAGVVLSDAAVAALTPGDTTAGEDPTLAAVNFFRTLWNRHRLLANDPARQFVVGSCGVGGRSIAQLSKGASPELFNRVRDCATATKAAVLALSETYGVAALCWFQGEDDIATAPATYKAALKQLGDDFEADINGAIGGGAARVPKFVYQTNNQWATDAPGPAQAQLDLSIEERDWFMFGPSYPYTDKGGHLDPNGYRWMGLQLGKVMYRVLALGQDWSPLRPLTPTFRGSTILIPFVVPAPPLVFDSPYAGFTPTTWASKGFAVSDSVGDVAIVSAEIVGDALVQLVVSRDLVAPVQVNYAQRTTFNGNGCLRDSDSTVSPEAYEYTAGTGQYAASNIGLVGQRYPLWNWCVAFNLTAAGD